MLIMLPHSLNLFIDLNSCLSFLFCSRLFFFFLLIYVFVYCLFKLPLTINELFARMLYTLKEKKKSLFWSETNKSFLCK